MIDRRTLLLAAAGLAAIGPAAAQGPVGLRLMTFNVNVRNTAFDRFSAYVEEVSPDVVLLQEADERWALDTVLADYPHRRVGVGKLVMATRLPLLDAAAFEAMPYAEKKKLGRRSTIQRAVMALDGGTDERRAAVLYNLHPASPRTARGRERQVEDYANFLRVMSADPADRTILAGGDFNALPDTPLFADLRRAIGLDLVAGDTLTLPTRFPKELGVGGWIGVPIDHVVCRGPVTVRRRVVGPDLGSDHLPVVADLEVRLPPVAN